MSVIQSKSIEQFHRIRREIIELNKTDLTAERVIGYREQLVPYIERSISTSARAQWYSFFSGYQSETDKDVLNEFRYEIVRHIDSFLEIVGSELPSRSIFEEHIIRVSDKKLSTLLKEFNQQRSLSPNSAAIAFRTILCLVIAQKASICAPTSNLATKQDLAFEHDINAAISTKLFDEGPTRLLKRFRDGGRKDTFDIVAHKKGDQAIIDNDDLSDAVDLLNALLPSIL